MIGFVHPKKLLEGLEQRARKRFGQNFLCKPEIVQKIVRGARLKPRDKVVEVGPGLGILTSAILATQADVTAIELDRDLASFLRERHPSLRLIEGDALKMCWPEVCEGSGWKMVANLPYNVGTHVFMSVLKERETFDTVVVMLQREVIDRLIAAPGSRTYGALSVQAQARGAIRFLLPVPPDSFHPQPKVQSAVIHVTVYKEPRVGAAGEQAFDRIVRAAFSQRRKKLSNSLAALYGKEEARRAVVELGFPEKVRAEALSLEDFCRLSDHLPPLDSE